MARSVSCPRNALWVLYCTPGLHEPESCYECVAESGVVDPDCEVCNGTGEIPADDDTIKWRWRDFVDDLRTGLKRIAPSLEDSDRWLGKEDRVLLENGHASIGLSEYMDLVAVWCVPKENEDGLVSPLAVRWGDAIEAKVERLLDTIATRLVRGATFSNGEAFYVKATDAVAA